MTELLNTELTQGINSTNASLMIAIDKLQQYELSHPLLIDAMLELTVASSLMSAYYQVQHSIYWKRASSKTRNRVSGDMADIAFKTKTAFLKAKQAVNQYVDEVGINPEQQELWRRMIFSLMLASEALEREHKGEIKVRQLSLFD